MPVLHVVIPVYNEPGTLEPCIRRVVQVQLPQNWTQQITLIDDNSDDEHYASVVKVIDQLKSDGHELAFHRHEVNQGKGAALQSGFDLILSANPSDDDLIIIQDADLEYDPDDFPKLVEPILSGRADAVIGNRWGQQYHFKSVKHRIHAWGNGVLTKLSNMMTGFRVSDMECCYKVVPIRLLRTLRPMLTERRFGIEPQIVASLARLGVRVEEVPVSYVPRGPASGKKIGWKDGVRAVIVIARERFRKKRTGTNK